MSKIIATAAIRGAHQLVGHAEEVLAKAIEAHGKDASLTYPNTGYYLPVIYGMLGLKVEKTQQVVDDDGEKLSDETVAKLEELEQFKKTEKERIEKEADTEKKKIADDKKVLEDRIEALEKQKGIKKSIDEKKDADDKDKKDVKKDDEEEDHYPSVYVPQIVRPE